MSATTADEGGADGPRGHPEAFVRLCEEAVAELLALKADPPMERGARIPGIRARLERIGADMAALDLTSPGFADEQGTLVDAASALQAVAMDRGGPHVPRFVDRMVADLRRIAAG